jgi:hypothetical protein
LRENRPTKKRIVSGVHSSIVCPRIGTSRIPAANAIVTTASSNPMKFAWLRNPRPIIPATTNPKTCGTRSPSITPPRSSGP